MRRSSIINHLGFKRILALVGIELISTVFVSIKAETKLPNSYSFSRGVEAYQEGKNQDALDWFNKELSEHPNNGYAQIYVSALRCGNEEYGKALSAINLALKNLPKKDKEYTAIAYGTRSGIYLVMEDSEGTVINLRAVDFGGMEQSNVRATVVRNQKAPLLLGQSVLGRLGKIEIDNQNRKLFITQYKK